MKDPKQNSRCTMTTIHIILSYGVWGKEEARRKVFIVIGEHSIYIIEVCLSIDCFTRSMVAHRCSKPAWYVRLEYMPVIGCILIKCHSMI